ncbi:MAG: DoxX family membrane protein [Myxococcales bacterium]|nr:DoxX family membrane protein [Myxococcales bacterium]
MKKLLTEWLAWGFRVALGVIFIVAAIPKIVDPKAFAWSISYYHMIPQDLINALAICLPMIELLAGVFLVVGVANRASLLLVSGMLVVFIIAIISAMVRNLDISCGCFSPGAKGKAMTTSTLTWDIVWLAMAVHAMIFDRERLSLGAALRRRRHGSKGATA